jgi:GNAT superfamily N-acetyltransferase
MEPAGGTAPLLAGDPAKPRKGAYGLRKERDGRGSTSRLDGLTMASIRVCEPERRLRCRLGRERTGGACCDAMLREAFTPVDNNMVTLRGGYALARRLVLLQERDGEEVPIAAAVIKVAEDVLEIPILVVEPRERKQGFGRTIVNLLAQMGLQLRCTMLVAWAAGTSLPFWARVSMLERQSASASRELRQAMIQYRQRNPLSGFSDSKMVATLL